MGKVIVTFTSPQLRSQTLREAVHYLLPSEDEFGSALLDLWGFKPAEIEIEIESVEDKGEEEV